MSFEIERLVGGLEPADGADPRTFPAIWNDSADEIEAVEGRVTTAEGDIGQLQTDVATLDTDDVVEAGNLYYTDARAEAAADQQIAAATTDDVSEGATNLYFTDGRVQAVITASDTDDLSEGVTNLYYTDGRVDAVIAASDTDDLSEGAANLYYTDARAEAAAPVQTVNTQTGTVVLGATDVQALPDDAELGDLADVVVTGAADGQLIAYNETNDQWELASPAGITVGDITALNLTWGDF